MHSLLNSFINFILEDSPKKKSVVPTGLFAGSFGKYYTDKELTQYAGKVSGGKWVPASQEPDTADTKDKGKEKTAPKNSSKPSASGTQPNMKQAATGFPGGSATYAAVIGQVEKGSAGAGTPESRAAEASVVLIGNTLLQDRKKFKGDIDKYLISKDAVIDGMVHHLSSLKGSNLTDDWKKTVKAQVIATLSQTEKKYGKIEAMVWDNTDGRSSLDLPQVKDKNDRSDLYIRTDSGDIIGVSLKKSGKVFLANQGYSRIIDTIGNFADDASTKTAIANLKKLHKTAVGKSFTALFDYIHSNKSKVSSALAQYNRTGVKSLSSPKYNEFFTSSGSPTPQFLQLAVSGKRLVPNEFKALMKCLDGVKKQNPEIKKLMDSIRDVDSQATKLFLHAIESNPKIKEATTKYLLDALDIPHMLTKGASAGIDHMVTVYGEGNVDDAGEPIPMYVNGSSIKETFGISKTANQEDALNEIKTRFIIDAESDKKVGMIRMRITNKTPPPNYYYPTISTLALRARGIGTAATFELFQHESWTFTLASKSPNPEDWTPQQRTKHAESTIRFLVKQAKNPMLTKQERQQALKDIEFYKNIT